jgi:hypothetical protein
MSQPEGPVYENPSADKFAPPPPPSDSRADDKRLWRRIAWFVGIYVAAQWLQLSRKTGGWLTPSRTAVIVYAVLSIVEQRIRNGEHDQDPYSTPTDITR